MAIVGSTCWGHSTGVTEDNTRAFSGNWTGTGSISGAGDAEEICLDDGEYMISEVVQTGAYTVTLFQNDYAAGDTVTMWYRHGASEVACEAAAWNLYVAGFTSLGYVQVKLENVAPLRVSSTNTRYLETVLGVPVWLTGFHTWYDVQDGGQTDPPPAFNWDQYLARLVSKGCNFTKLWTCETSEEWAQYPDDYIYPTRYERTGPGNANDGKLKWDVTQVNAEWMARLRARAIDCLNNGIYVCVQMFQSWQIESKGSANYPFLQHPYHLSNNINSLDGDDNNDDEGTETHSDTNNNAWATQQALIAAVVAALGDLGNVIWEVANETTGSTAAYNWQEDIVAYIKAQEDANGFDRHPVGMTKFWPENSIGDDDLQASDADWVSYSAGYADATVDGTRVSMYDTDHTVGIEESDIGWPHEALCNGHGGAWYMDKWYPNMYQQDKREDATYEQIRANCGYAADIANSRVNNLLLMTPQPGLCSTGYCLARDHATAAEYICYQWNTGNFTLDLTNATGTLNIFWRRCSNGDTDTDTVAGGAERTLSPPWAGLCVAYVYH